MDPRAWTRLRPGKDRQQIPPMTMEEIQADYARREAEQRAERMQQQAELERARLEYQTGVQPTPVPKETLEGFTETQF
jgi:hypothetical protein